MNGAVRLDQDDGRPSTTPAKRAFQLERTGIDYPGGILLAVEIDQQPGGFESRDHHQHGKARTVSLPIPAKLLFTQTLPFILSL